MRRLLATLALATFLGAAPAAAAQVSVVDAPAAQPDPMPPAAQPDPMPPAGQPDPMPPA